MTPTEITEYLTETDGRWQGRLTWTEGGERRYRRRSFGRVAPRMGRPPAGTVSEAAAREQLAAMRAELERELGLDLDQRSARETVTFGDLALAWFEDSGRDRGREWSPATRRDYRSALGLTKGEGHIMPALGHLLVGELTANRARAWWRTLNKLSARNANKQLTIVRRVFAWATEDGRWGKLEDPTVGIAKHAETSAATTGEAPLFFELAEVEAIAQAAEELHEAERRNPVRRGHDHVSRHDAAIFTVIAQTGLRRGELVTLRVGDVDLPGRVLTVRTAVSAGEEKAPKGGRVRRVPLTDPAIEVLEPLVEGRDAAAYVFSTLKGGRLDPDALSRRFLRARDRAGFVHTGLTVHDLRHSTASLLARAGYAQTEIQDILGHAKLETTARYMHHRPRFGDAERLTRALAGTARTPGVAKLAGVG
jgi:integrase